VAHFHSILGELREFIDNTYIPDVLAVGQAYQDYFAIGRGCGNLLAYGGYPQSAGEDFFPGGIYLSGKEAVKRLIDSTLSELGLSTDALFSVMGRHLVRALECKLIADAMADWL